MVEKGKDQSDVSQILIGSRNVENYIFDPKNSSIYSIDNLRLSLKLNPRKFDSLQRKFDTFISDDEYSSSSNRLAGFRIWWTHKFESAGSSINAGIGWNKPGGKIDESKGYIEFNPNKLHKQGLNLLDHISDCCESVEVKRYDLAIDFPIAREEIRVIPDKRIYEYTRENSMTEYLGRRSKIGRVKVYDKAAESGLDYPLTRVELTANSEWCVEEIIKYLPDCYSPNNVSFEGVKTNTKVAILAMNQIAMMGGVIDPYIQMLEPHSRAKVKNILKSNVSLNYSSECVAGIKEKLEFWKR